MLVTVWVLAAASVSSSIISSLLARLLLKTSILLYFCYTIHYLLYLLIFFGFLVFEEILQVTQCVFNKLFFNVIQLKSTSVDGKNPDFTENGIRNICSTEPLGNQGGRKHLITLKGEETGDKHLIKLSPESPQNETPTKSKIWEVSVTVGI